MHIISILIVCGHMNMPTPHQLTIFSLYLNFARLQCCHALFPLWGFICSLEGGSSVCYICSHYNKYHTHKQTSAGQFKFSTSMKHSILECKVIQWRSLKPSKIRLFYVASQVLGPRSHCATHINKLQVIDVYGAMPVKHDRHARLKVSKPQLARLYICTLLSTIIIFIVRSYCNYSQSEVSPRPMSLGLVVLKFVTQKVEGESGP